MGQPTFDLQSHSRHSDGTLSPREVVRAAAAVGVELLALSDHDTVGGVIEAARAAQHEGIGLVSAVEISAIDPLGQDLHILGYLIDPQNGELLERLESWRADRLRRGEAMVAALRELGFQLDEQRLLRRSRAGKPIGRPHVARAVVEHPANAGRLARERLEDPAAFLEAYLVEGRPAFRPRRRPTVAEAIDTIHRAGGVAVWAHPFWELTDADAVTAAIARFQRAGLDGVECFYPTHSRAQTTRLYTTCSELGLLATGSSDFHGPDHHLFCAFRSFSTYGLEARLGPIAEAGRRGGDPLTPGRDAWPGAGRPCA
jgi:predicted metal-dependent phosphoesterase TrpH